MALFTCDAQIWYEVLFCKLDYRIGKICLLCIAKSQLFPLIAYSGETALWGQCKSTMRVLATMKCRIPTQLWCLSGRMKQWGGEGYLLEPGSVQRDTALWMGICRFMELDKHQ